MRNLCNNHGGQGPWIYPEKQKMYTFSLFSSDLIHNNHKVKIVISKPINIKERGISSLLHGFLEY